MNQTVLTTLASISIPTTPARTTLAPRAARSQRSSIKPAAALQTRKPHPVTIRAPLIAIAAAYQPTGSWATASASSLDGTWR